ncbi:MAG: hypothetical protein IT551_02830 [Novosphingobium sp.]|jgi:DNA-binding response OmpR family regulator|nr:hypothetical protein [Novosphingobium sp.]
MNARLTGRRIFVVEDEWLIAADLTEHLERSGAIIVGPASSVREALKTLSTLDRLPDVASLDLKLSDGTSVQIAEELGRLGVPFIFVTGSPELIPECFRMCLACPKPILARAWLNALAEVIDG